MTNDTGRLFGKIGLGLLAIVLLFSAGPPAARAADPIPGLADGYYVRPVYVVASDEDRPLDPEWKAKYQTAMILTQRFYEEEMQRNGYGYRQFNMELEADGRPQIYFVRSKYTRAELEASGGNAPGLGQPELEQVFDRDKSVVVLMWAYRAWIGGRHVTPGTRGGYAFIGDTLSLNYGSPYFPDGTTGSLMRYLSPTVDGQIAIFRDTTIPSNPPDQATNWTTAAIASARLGGMAHEIGHAFGVQHSVVGNDLMGYGMYSFGNYFTGSPSSCFIHPGNALHYSNSAFFRPETSYADNTDPVVDVDIPLLLPGQSIPYTITASDSGAGLALVGIDFEGVTKHYGDLRGSSSPATYSYTLKPNTALVPGNYGTGVQVWDQASNRGYVYPTFRVVSSLPAVPPAAVVDPNEKVYLEDSLVPATWDTVGPDRSEGASGGWMWNRTFKASGAKGVVHPTEAGKQTEIFLFSAPKSLSVETGDVLTIYVYIDPASKPEMIAMSWFKNTWGWSTYAYWGDDKLVNWDGSLPTRVRMGDLPATGGWVRLTVPASAVEMEGKAIGGCYLFAHGAGNVFWDRLGKVSRIDDSNLVSEGVSASVSGTNVTVTDSVRNNGTQAVSAPFKVRYYLSADSAITPSDALLGERTVNGLDTGAVSAATATYPVPAGVASGSYCVGAVADGGFQILETCETDNAAATSPVPIVVSKPDLVVSALSAKVATGKVSVSSTIKNQGTTPTAGTFHGSFYLSSDKVASPSTDYLLGSRARTTPLAAGSQTAATNAYAVPASVPPGSYYVVGVADSTNTQSESNESNNAAATIGPLSIKADLVVSAISATRSGATLSVKSTVKNEGPLSTSGSFRVDIYLSKDATITTADTRIGSRTVSASLAYNATNLGTTTLAIPTGLAAGTYRVGAIADGGLVVSETIETNNAKAASLSVTIGP